jgi:hypothetical protein
MRILDQHKYFPPLAEQELLENALQRMAGVLPDQSHRDLLKELLDQGLQRALERLKEYAQFQPDRFSLQEVNERLAGFCHYGISRAKAPVGLQCERSSGQFGCQIHVGISVTVSRRGKGPFDRFKVGYTGKPAPELLYLEARWASLIPYGGVARLLEDVLPLAYTQNGMTIRNHVLKTAERIEADLGEEKPVFFDGSEQDWEAQPPPDGPMTIGIDR